MSLQGEHQLSEEALLVGEISDDYSAVFEDELDQFLVSTHLLVHTNIIIWPYLN